MCDIMEILYSDKALYQLPGYFMQGSLKNEGLNGSKNAYPIELLPLWFM